MRVRPLVWPLILLLVLAGCYRQAEDSFQTVNNQGGDPAQVIPATPTESVTIIDPNSGQPLTTQEALPAASPTESILILQPGATATDSSSAAGQEAAPTATIIIIEPPALASATPPGAPPVQPVGVATATPPQVITPVTGNPAQVLMPSATATVTPLPGSQLQPTPTDLDEPVVGECSDTVAAGDNLYRIALRNNVVLADLLRENNLSENSIIQPGQVLRLPNCIPTGDGAAATVPPGPAAPAAPATPPPAGTVVHVVQSGETLSVIARQYGVSIQSIVDANNLTNPDRLAIGQEILIPGQ
ncbi:MAG: LysM peptidoglycan-binding domain-containing protein [Anaerolineae bacterium]|nr:LysM peptidoglycan-binding domain-containing protein [Anaerolineae bacterium]